MDLAEFYAARNRTSGFMDPNYGGTHWGQDFNSASRLPAGTPIPSLSTGRVVRNSWQDAHGWYIAVQADQSGWYWTYSHRQGGAGIDIGELIQKGESVGLLGNTGWSTAPHVHVQYTQYPDPWQHTWSGTVDPWPHIQRALASWSGGDTKPITPEEEPMLYFHHVPLDAGGSAYFLENAVTGKLQQAHNMLDIALMRKWGPKEIIWTVEEGGETAFKSGYGLIAGLAPTPNTAPTVISPSLSDADLARIAALDDDEHASIIEKLDRIPIDTIRGLGDKLAN